MQVQRIAGNTFLVCYLCITLCAFVATVFRIVLPIVPRSALMFSYGMMAPYQDPGTKHEELLAEGLQDDGTWKRIDLAPYYPVLFGERNLREYRSMFARTDDEAYRTWSRTMFADTLQRLEMEKGTSYSALRLSWLLWPAVPGDFHMMDKEGVTEKTLLLEKKYE